MIKIIIFVFLISFNFELEKNIYFRKSEFLKKAASYNAIIFFIIIILLLWYVLHVKKFQNWLNFVIYEWVFKFVNFALKGAAFLT